MVCVLLRLVLGVKVRIGLGFDLIKIRGMFCEGRLLDGHDEGCIPSGLFRHSYYGSSTHDLTIWQTNKILIAANRSAEENSMSPFMVEF